MTIIHRCYECEMNEPTITVEAMQAEEEYIRRIRNEMSNALFSAVRPRGQVTADHVRKYFKEKFGMEAT